MKTKKETIPEPKKRGPKPKGDSLVVKTEKKGDKLAVKIAKKIFERAKEANVEVFEEKIKSLVGNETFGQLEHPDSTEPPYGKMSNYPEFNADDWKWGVKNEESPETIEEKIDKIIGFLNSIESELIELNKPTELTALVSETNNFSLEEMSWETLVFLHKQAGETIIRLNYNPACFTEEYKFAQKRVEKISQVLDTRLKSIDWS